MKIFARISLGVVLLGSLATTAVIHVAVKRIVKLEREMELMHCQYAAVVPISYQLFSCTKCHYH